jgi:hypothetical protein
VICQAVYEGTLYSDAVSAQAPPDTPLGYKPVAMDELPSPTDVMRKG